MPLAVRLYIKQIKLYSHHLLIRTGLRCAARYLASCSERNVERKQATPAVRHRLQSRRDSGMHLCRRLAELERAHEGGEDHLELVDSCAE